jgi:hypothetical protein
VIYIVNMTNHYEILIYQVHGTPSGGKAERGEQYLTFDRGSLSSPCVRTRSYKRKLFMPHHETQVGVLHILYCTHCIAHTVLHVL